MDQERDRLPRVVTPLRATHTDNNADELNAAVRKIRSGYLTADQREALAALVVIAGNTTLSTPVIAAVFNVITACMPTSHKY